MRRILKLEISFFGNGVRHTNEDDCNISFYFSFPSQIVTLMKPIVAASSHVLCTKDINEGDQFFGIWPTFLWLVSSDCKEAPT